VRSDAGFADVWGLNRFYRDGFTCRQNADLLNRRSALNERIDRVRVLAFTLRSARRFATGRFSIPPLAIPPSRASDHAGVVSRITFY
jgi:hypothetical protein